MNPQPTLITYQPEESFPGGLAKTIDLPSGQTVLVRRGDDLQALSESGPHIVRSAWGGLLGREVPDVWLVDTGPTTLHPYFPDLLDADGQLISADMLVQAQVADPDRFWRALSVGYSNLSRAQLDWLLVEKLQQAVRSLVRRFPWDSLLHLPEAKKTIEQGFMQSLRAALAEWGMELRAVTHLSFQQAKDAVAIQRQVQEIRSQLDDMTLQGEIEQLDNERILEHARRELEQELTEAEAAELQQAIEEQPTATAVRQFQESRLQRLKRAVETRLSAFAQSEVRAEAELEPETNGAYERMQDLVPLLRLVAAGIALITAYGTVYFPHVIRYNDNTRLILVTVGFVLALAALISSYVINHQYHLHRRKARALLTTRHKESDRDARIIRERGIRRYMEKRLRQVAANCEKTWKRVFDDDMNLATELRNNSCKPYHLLADKVLAVDYRTKQYLGREDIPLEDLAELLALTEGVLGRTENMVKSSKEAYNAATLGDLATVRKIGLALDQGGMDIENRFAEREQFLSR